MSNIGSWALAAASNNATPPNGWPEGQAPSTVNNCAREMMSAIRTQWDDAVWFNFYPTTSPSTYISLKSQNKIRISNQSAATTYTATDIYPVGTRLKVNNGNVNKYGSVVSLSSSSTAVILTMTMDSGTLTSTITTVSRSIITPGSNSPLPSTSSSPVQIDNVGGRLTLTTGVPVTTSDVTGATTLYYTPYVGNVTAVYNGSDWIAIESAEISIAVPATTVTMYDVFVYSNSGTLTLELTAWTNDTTRATALAYQDGVLVKSGTITRRYLGSFRTTGVSGQTEDSATKRFLWNYYNRIRKTLTKVSADSTWTYTTETWRQANNSAANQVEFVIGLMEDTVELILQESVSNSSNANASVAIGLNSTSNPATGTTNVAVDMDSTICDVSARLNTFARIGYSYAAWLEISSASGTTTWYGASTVSASISVFCGLSGFMSC